MRAGCHRGGSNRDRRAGWCSLSTAWARSIQSRCADGEKLSANDYLGNEREGHKGELFEPQSLKE